MFPSCTDVLSSIKSAEDSYRKNVAELRESLIIWFALFVFQLAPIMRNSISDEPEPVPRSCGLQNSVLGVVTGPGAFGLHAPWNFPPHPSTRMKLPSANSLMRLSWGVNQLQGLKRASEGLQANQCNLPINHPHIFSAPISFSMQTNTTVGGVCVCQLLAGKDFLKSSFYIFFFFVSPLTSFESETTKQLNGNLWL